MIPILRPNGRLSLCADFVREGSRLADIGTDHAYLPIALCLSGKITSALACDINPRPLDSARENIAKYGLSDRIAVRLSDGLQEVAPEEADDIVIAGMGGELIRDILTAAPWVRNGDKRLILQPMTHHDDLIVWLFENGFAVERQAAVLDEKKYYTVLCVRYDGIKRGCDLLTATVGALDVQEPCARGFLGHCLSNLRKRSRGDASLLSVAEQLEEMLDEAE